MKIAYRFSQFVTLEMAKAQAQQNFQISKKEFR